MLLLIEFSIFYHAKVFVHKKAYFYSRDIFTITIFESVEYMLDLWYYLIEQMSVFNQNQNILSF